MNINKSNENNKWKRNEAVINNEKIINEKNK